MEIQDFQCTYDNLTGICEEATKGLHLTFPDAYMHAETMVELALALKEYSKAPFCELPFCHTLEAEAMGGMINYGDAMTGPRAKEYICQSMEEVLELPEIDFQTGRICETLKACRILREKGEHVVFEVSGPFTILNVLIDARYVFRTLRKKPELAERVFWKLGEQILAFMEQAKAYGADMISYADSSGGVNILGPKMAEQVVEMFTHDFLKRAEKIADGKTMLLLCPKTTYALIGTGHAQFVEHEMEEVVDFENDISLSYGEACILLIGKVKMAGDSCIKDTKHEMRGKFREVKLISINKTGVGKN